MNRRNRVTERRGWPAGIPGSGPPLPDPGSCAPAPPERPPLATRQPRLFISCSGSALKSLLLAAPSTARTGLCLTLSVSLSVSLVAGVDPPQPLGPSEGSAAHSHCPPGDPSPESWSLGSGTWLGGPDLGGDPGLSSSPRALGTAGSGRGWAQTSAQKSPSPHHCRGAGSPQTLPALWGAFEVSARCH